MSAVGEVRTFVEKVNRCPEHIKEEKNRVFQFDIKESGSIQIILKEGQAYLLEENLENPDVAMQLAERDLLKLLHGDLNPTMAFMTGKLKVDGKIGLALKLQELVRLYQEV
ncbi:SCP2 sterol-binding domain-containing protein [Alkalihalobacillus sp. MEB130]|uniref:SCP2 sterol-binding domain-containing protein n=1 Tax=Alkalihalobacillus sp. MEB130 TaxID=2976704 RepID=UPI0028DDAF1F|nr:SCP2 sterol-binding domain-containing protein [Alkalihalobacillus sp. MEB130]MDT8860629.1 SCP2 sterol-binding domain-containing protein [Alkalihalobacillus sp. MEB130]